MYAFVVYMPACFGVSAYPAKIIISRVMSSIGAENMRPGFRAVRSSMSFFVRSKMNEYIFH